MAAYRDLAKTGENLTDASAIKDSIENMLFLSRGEVLFNRLLGSRLESYLFQPLSFAVSRLIYMDIRTSLSHDKRIKLLNTSGVRMDTVNRSYSVHLDLEVDGIGAPIVIDRTLKVKA